MFVNGLPLGVIELKNPGEVNAILDRAFDQLQSYKAQIASLFRANVALVISDGIAARIGSLTADRERFMPWRTITGDDLAPKSAPELETLLKGVFDRQRQLDVIRDFIVFGGAGSDATKILAGYHQFYAVRHAVARTIAATAPEGDRKVGVIWHTHRRPLADSCAFTSVAGLRRAPAFLTPRRRGAFALRALAPSRSGGARR